MKTVQFVSEVEAACWGDDPDPDDINAVWRTDAAYPPKERYVRADTSRTNH